MSYPIPEEITRINYAPIKKRIHTNMDTVIVGDARKALFRQDLVHQFIFSPKKTRKSPKINKSEKNASEEVSDGEQAVEESPNMQLSKQAVLDKLQVASLIFDNLPSFSSSQLQNKTKPKKTIRLEMTIQKSSYLSIFGKLGIHKDLSHCVMPPDDAFDLFCKQLRASGLRGPASSDSALLLKWNALTEEEKNKYEEKLDEIKRVYNKQFSEENKQKLEGKLPLYEERKITDVKALGELLGPLSIERKYTGFRTVAGQMTVVVRVNAPIRLVFDESDNSLQFHFSVSPYIDEWIVY